MTASSLRLASTLVLSSLALLATFTAGHAGKMGSISPFAGKPMANVASSPVVRDHRTGQGQNWGTSQGGGVTVTGGRPRACGKTIACGGQALAPNVRDHRDDNKRDHRTP